MSEILDRMGARIESDMKRGVSFSIGMKHFIDYVREATSEIDSKIKRIEDLGKGLK